MFESQHLQSLWFTGLAAHHKRTSHEAYRLAGPGRESWASILRALNGFARRAAQWQRNLRKASSSSPDCCPAPVCR
jgi:hypothetical protein